MGFNAVASTREDLFIDVSITNVANSNTNIDKARAIYFLGVQTKFNFELF